MKGAERRDEVLRIVRARGYVNVTEAARELGVNSSTIRRDLARLVQLGLIERSHGGAIAVNDEAEIPYDVKIARRVAEKQAIGELVASLIPNDSTVIIDSGSTAFMVARALADHRGMTVITPDIRVGAELVARPDVRLIVPGGEALPATTTLLSQEAVESMRRYHVDVAVMAADAVDPEGVTNINSAVVPLKRAMIGAARRAILAIDSSKFGIRKLVTVAPVEEFSEVVTDDGLDEAVAGTYPVPVLRAALEQERTVLA